MYAMIVEQSEEIVSAVSLSCKSFMGVLMVMMKSCVDGVSGRRNVLPAWLLLLQLRVLNSRL